METEKRRKSIFRDVCLILSFVAIGLVTMLVLNLTRRAGSVAQVSVDGVPIQSFDLDADGIHSLNGGSNVLEIKDGRARLIEATCPNHLCIGQGWVQYNGQSIVCLPNRLSVTIRGGKGEYDIVM